jgi:hypothetical protein
MRMWMWMWMWRLGRGREGEGEGLLRGVWNGFVAVSVRGSKYAGLNSRACSVEVEAEVDVGVEVEVDGEGEVDVDGDVDGGVGECLPALVGACLSPLARGSK